MLVGDSGVGKTNLVSRFAWDTFDEESKATIGVEFATKNIVVEGKVIKVQLWDTAGQERFRAMTNAYYRGAVGALIVYAINNRPSYDNIAKWLSELRGIANKDMCVMVVGNKSDLCEQRVVTTEEATVFAKEHNTAFMEMSALSGSNVEKAFDSLVSAIYQKEKNSAVDSKPTEAAPQTTTISLNDPAPKKDKKGCC